MVKSKIHCPGNLVLIYSSGVVSILILIWYNVNMNQ